MAKHEKLKNRLKAQEQKKREIMKEKKESKYCFVEPTYKRRVRITIGGSGKERYKILKAIDLRQQTSEGVTGQRLNRESGIFGVYADMDVMLLCQGMGLPMTRLESTSRQP